MKLIKMNIKSKISIPFNAKIVIWKNSFNDYYRLVLLHNSKIYKISTRINKKYIYIDKWNNVIYFKKKKFQRDYIKINNLFDFFLKSWNNFFYNKIKFKGKGFRIKFFKKIKLIKFYFGRSHKTFMLLKNIKRKRINKYKFLIIGLNKKSVNNNSTKIVLIKPINIYTLRGLRKSKQIVFKRKGKKGTYI